MQSQQGLRSGRAQRGTTCVHCRRMKLRCDASAKFPSPCSRCARVGRQCLQGTTSLTLSDDSTEDPWSRIAELEKHLKDLRGKVQNSPNQHGLEQRGSGHSPAGDAAPEDDLEPAESDGSAAKLAGVIGLTAPIMSLGDLEISPEDFFDSVDLFYVHFHPQLPFLSGKRTLLQDSLGCPLLAWAIVAVAARVSPNLNRFRARLTWPVRRLASQSVLSTRSLATIQALLLLCFWPMPYAALVDDPSWVFSGIAIQKALQLGMYRPLETLIDHAKGDHRTAMSMQRIWLACLVVGQMQSIRHGIPSTIPIEHVDPHLLVSQGGSHVSQVLITAIELTRKDMVISSLLSQRDGTNSSLGCPPALRALGIELEQLDANVQQFHSPLLRRMLCTTKIRLYSFALRPSSIDHDGPQLPPAGTRSSQAEPADLTIYISKAYTIATHIITTSLDDHENIQKWSFIDLQSFIMALFTVLQISRRNRNLCDILQVSDMMQRASTLLKSCSIIDGDHFYRVCEIIDYLSAKAPVGDESRDQPVDAETMVSTIRPGAGIGVAYDMVKEAKKRYRRSVRFPEEFPDLGSVGTSTGSGSGVEMETGSSSAGDGAGDQQWMLEDPMMQSFDFNFAGWAGWDGDLGLR